MCQSVNEYESVYPSDRPFSIPPYHKICSPHRTITTMPDGIKKTNETKYVFRNPFSQKAMTLANVRRCSSLRVIQINEGE